MNIELSDETFSSIMVAELQELHRHCTDPLFECEDVEKFQAAVRLVLEQYMVPQEYVQWEIENKWMNKKPLAYQGLMGGITIESAIKIFEFLRAEADMDDDLTSVEYYNGVLDGMNSVTKGEIFSQKLQEEIKAYGIETIEHPTSVLGDDRSLIELGEDGY